MRAGHQSLTLEIEGHGVDQLVNEAGGHRIQRIPPTEQRGRVHSSTVTVAVLDEHASEPTQRQPDDFIIEWYSGSGAGGQHRNKHMCSARITHRPTGLVRTAQTRSRQNSLQLAMLALTEELDRMAEQAAKQQQNSSRRDQVGSGQRSDKRRTIRFQHDEVVDHITGRRTTVKDYMRGRMDVLWR